MRLRRLVGKVFNFGTHDATKAVVTFLVGGVALDAWGHPIAQEATRRCARRRSRAAMSSELTRSRHGAVITAWSSGWASQDT